MLLKKAKLLASVGAVALSVALYANAASAVAIQSGGSVQIVASTVVNNNIDVTVTNGLQFGTFGTIVDGAGTDLATATISTAGVFTGDAGVAKVIDAQAGDHAAATITVSAFPTTNLYVDYSTPTQVSGTGGTPLHKFDVTLLGDNLLTPTTGTGGANGGWNSTPTFTQGRATTTGGGALVFKIGGVLTTQDIAYASQTYAGSFDITLSY